MAMDPELKAKWIEALRSGEYKQCRGKLHKELVGYCCLGVLCDIDSQVTENMQHGIGIFQFEGRFESSYLPTGYRSKIGLDSQDEANLVHMNDTNKSFSEIADYIEANF